MPKSSHRALKLTRPSARMRTGGVPPGIHGDVYRINRLRHWDFLQHGRVRILTRAASNRFFKQRIALADLGYSFNERLDEFVYGTERVGPTREEAWLDLAPFL
ncbi:hypothetical protein EXIGLDRAFT_763467 [Exidia glandulosa HHB12029]|uniref:Uncharacterized protein n=1 Tax=Exidia glandulosa HHB12029 TaxID=1314781 RepID=A0A165LXE5_EXIGL|nr:hypothetical protein EXIGLDRAFT_763467 [Exidia glandulosa HHB12029]